MNPQNVGKASSASEDKQKNQPWKYDITPDEMELAEESENELQTNNV